MEYENKNRIIQFENRNRKIEYENINRKDINYIEHSKWFCLNIKTKKLLKTIETTKKKESLMPSSFDHFFDIRIILIAEDMDSQFQYSADVIVILFHMIDRYA